MDAPSPAPKLEAVVDHLGSRIATGAIAVGEKFTLHELGSQFGISRTVAREAMRALEQLGMVESSRRVGITVTPIDRWAVFDAAVISWRLAHDKTRNAQLDSLNQLRLGVEPVAARLCAQYASRAQRAEIYAQAEKLHRLIVTPSHRVGEQLRTDLEFHTLILQASGNEMFAALAPVLLAMSKGKSIFGSVKRDPVAGTDDLHMDLAQSIVDGDADRAEELSRSILDYNRA